MLATIFIGLTIVFMIANLYYFFTGHKYKKSYFQSSLFQKLFYTMIGITIGFAVLYYLLSLEHDVIRIGTEDGENGGETFTDFLYFSGVTMLSVGYGDLVPIGSARLFALIQAGIGLLLPTAYFIRAMNEKKDNENTQENPQGNDEDGKEEQGNFSDKRSKGKKEEREMEKVES